MRARGNDNQPIPWRPATQKDVAERAGVSIMAVSTVVTGKKSTVGVSEATRARILKAIEDLQYRPNELARSLRQQFTGTIGFYNGYGYINTADPFIRTIYHGVSMQLQEQDEDILIFNAIYNDRRELLIERILSQKIDGLIVLPTTEDDAMAKVVRSRHLPTINIAELVPGLNCITADDLGGSSELARHIVSRGHKRILYRRSSMPFHFEARRFEAFKAAAEEGGASVVPCKANDGMDNVTGQEELMLNSGNRPVTAIVCWHDHSAIRMFDYCAAKGIQVPGDVAIAGFDGIAQPGFAPNLTTVVAHWDQIARTAPKLLKQVLNGEVIADHTTIPSDLHIGSTT